MVKKPILKYNNNGSGFTMKNPAAELEPKVRRTKGSMNLRFGGASLFEKKKSCGLFSFYTGGLLPRHRWRRN
jgi:hypothetical protein